MIILFLILLLLGILHLWFWYRQQQRTRLLRSVESVPATQRIRQYSLGQRSGKFFSDVRFHLIGKQHSVVLQHGLVILLALAGGGYINQGYLHLSLFVVLPVVFVLTLNLLYLRSKKKMRQVFESEFSEALNVINSSVRAGNSVIQGIDQCGKKMEGIVGKEFHRVVQRLEIGEEAENVFMDSYRRLPYREYYFFIITVLNNMKGGGQVKEVMSRLGTLISDARIMERKKYAKTSEIRMSIKILTVIPVFFFFFLKYQSPASFDILLYHPTGKMMLYYAIASILSGLLIVWMMMNKI